MIDVSEPCLFDVGLDRHIHIKFDGANINTITLYVNTFIKKIYLKGTISGAEMSKSRNRSGEIPSNPALNGCVTSGIPE